jgi:hypothetical protein
MINVIILQILLGRRNFTFHIRRSSLFPTTAQISLQLVLVQLKSRKRKKAANIKLAANRSDTNL